jgi:hypothetical protein
MATGYDISASASDSTTQSSQFGTGAWNVGGNNSLKWMPLALVAAFIAWIFANRKS